MADRQPTTAATHDPWHGRNPWGCCQDRNTHGGPGCKWPGTETEPLTTPATAARRDALFWTDAALIIVITDAFCTVLCLATRGPWWGKAIVCAMGTFNGVFGWWLICRPERDHA